MVSPFFFPVCVAIRAIPFRSRLRYIQMALQMAMLRWSWLVCATLVVAEEGKWPTCLEGGVAYTNLLDAPAEVEQGFF